MVGADVADGDNMGGSSATIVGAVDITENALRLFRLKGKVPNEIGVRAVPCRWVLRRRVSASSAAVLRRSLRICCSGAGLTMLQAWSQAIRVLVSTLALSHQPRLVREISEPSASPDCHASSIRGPRHQSPHAPIPSSSSQAKGVLAETCTCA